MLNNFEAFQNSVPSFSVVLENTSYFEMVQLILSITTLADDLNQCQLKMKLDNYILKHIGHFRSATKGIT